MCLGSLVRVWRPSVNWHAAVQLYGTVGKTVEALETLVGKSDAELNNMGYVNQRGLSRKVDRCLHPLPPRGTLY